MLVTGQTTSVLVVDNSSPRGECLTKERDNVRLVRSFVVRRRCWHAHRPHQQLPLATAAASNNNSNNSPATDRPTDSPTTRCIRGPFFGARNEVRTSCVPVTHGVHHCLTQNCRRVARGACCTFQRTYRVARCFFVCCFCRVFLSVCVCACFSSAFLLIGPNFRFCVLVGVRVSTPNATGVGVLKWRPPTASRRAALHTITLLGTKQTVSSFATVRAGRLVSGCPHQRTVWRTLELVG